MYVGMAAEERKREREREASTRKDWLQQGRRSAPRGCSATSLRVQRERASLLLAVPCSEVPVVHCTAYCATDRTSLAFRTASHDIAKHARTTSGSVRGSVCVMWMWQEADVTIAWYWETIRVQRTEREAEGKKQGIFTVRERERGRGQAAGQQLYRATLYLSRTPSVCSTFCSSVLSPSPGFFQLHQ